MKQLFAFFVLFLMLSSSANAQLFSRKYVEKDSTTWPSMEKFCLLYSQDVYIGDEAKIKPSYDSETGRMVAPPEVYNLEEGDDPFIRRLIFDQIPKKIKITLIDYSELDLNTQELRDAVQPQDLGVVEIDNGIVYVNEQEWGPIRSQLPILCSEYFEVERNPYPVDKPNNTVRN